MKNTFVNKKSAVAILLGTTVFMAAFTCTAIPADAHGKGRYVEFVSEYMENNRGTVDTNDDEIENNYGTVRANNQDAIIYNNKGTVSENSGNVYYNYGEVTNNFRCGCVYNVGGTVVNNYEEAGVYGGSGYEGDENAKGTNSLIVNNIGGDVINGYSPDDLLTITNYYYGDISEGYSRVSENKEVKYIDYKGKVHIVNNFSENEFEDEDFITVEKQFHSIDVADTANVEVTYDGFTYGEYDQKQYVQVAENSDPVEIDASITFRAADGYELTDEGEREVDTDELSYNLYKNDDGSYTVKITALKRNVELTLDALHLMVTE